MKSSWIRNVVVAGALVLLASVACAASPGEILPNDATGGLLGSCCVFFGLSGARIAQNAVERHHHGGPAPIAAAHAQDVASSVPDADYRPTGKGPSPIKTLDGEWKVVSAGERWRAVTASRTVEGTVVAVSQRGVLIDVDGGATVVVLAKDLTSLVRR